MAADLAGVSYRSVARWVKRGSEEASGPHHDFCQAIKKIIAEQAAQSIQAIVAESATTWQAAAWLLERRHPDKWSGTSAELRAMRKEFRELQKALKDVAEVRRESDDRDTPPQSQG